MQRLSPGRARDHPVMDIIPNKALSLSLSLSLSRNRRLSRIAPVDAHKGVGGSRRPRKVVLN